jgi:hypothetical protein
MDQTYRKRGISSEIWKSGVVECSSPAVSLRKLKTRQKKRAGGGGDLATGLCHFETEENGVLCCIGPSRTRDT